MLPLPFLDPLGGKEAQAHLGANSPGIREHVLQGRFCPFLWLSDH